MTTEQTDASTSETDIASDWSEVASSSKQSQPAPHAVMQVRFRQMTPAV